MNAVALVTLASGLAVGFGWRPMPDGSPRYEYVVQIEPEMLEALADGQSIPIVAEVPEDVQAIGRIRIVVGRGELPREQGTVRLRPVGDGDGAVTAEGGGDASTVELTQYSEAAPRYEAPVAPPQYGAAPSGATFDPYTEVPPVAGGAGGGSWNGDAAAVNPLRTAEADGAAGGSGWNGAAADGAGGAPAGGPFAAVGDGIREATEPVREGIDRFGGRVRGAADDLGERTQELLDDLRPDALFGAGPADPSGGAAAPGAVAAPPAIPPVWNPGVDAGSAPVWNGGDAAADAATAGAVPGAAPGGDAPGSSWNDGAGGAATVPDYSDAPPLATGDGAPAPVRGADADPWGNASDPRFRGDPAAAGGAPAGGAGVGGAAAGGSPPAGTLPWPGTAPLFPDAAGAAAAAGAGAGGAGPVLGGATGSPAISSDMLDQAASRPLDGGASLLDAAASAPTGAAAAPTVPSVTAQAWDGAEGRATTTAATGGEPAAPPDAGSSARHKAAVILAWVLLSGSAAGNIYLFWSYLDVRTKYRALVRKTARAVGSRFSAA